MRLEYAVEDVKRLEPGWKRAFDRRELSEIGIYEYNGATFTPADRILENVVGSAYEFLYYHCPVTRDVIFERLMKPLDNGLLTYVSPDRRRLYRQRPTGFYERATT